MNPFHVTFVMLFVAMGWIRSDYRFKARTNRQGNQHRSPSLSQCASRWEEISQMDQVRQTLERSEMAGRLQADLFLTRTSNRNMNAPMRFLMTQR